MNLPAAKLEPDALDPVALRKAFGRFGTGVTIVTVMSPSGPVGMTANSFSSVSLDPPLVLWSIARASRRYPAFEASGRMAIHVLCEEQDLLCKAFAKSHDAFGEARWHVSEHGVPLLEGCLARFECRQYAEYDGGDHAIIVGEVERALIEENGDPLLFFGGRFGSFTAQSAGG